MEHIAIKARPRPPRLTKGQRRISREQGSILASVYGRGMESVSVTIEARDLARVFNAETGANTLIDLTVDGQRHLVKITNLEMDRINRRPLHLGLYKLETREPTRATLPVELVGEPEAVGTGAGTLEHAVQTVDVRALPEDMVASLTLDISDLQVGGVKRASDLQLPKGYELLSDPDTALASLRPSHDLASELATEEAAENAVLGTPPTPAAEEPAE